MKVSEWDQDHTTWTIASDWADGEHKAIKAQYTRSLTPTTAQPFCKWFGGASSQSVKVSEQDQWTQPHWHNTDWPVSKSVWDYQLKERSLYLKVFSAGKCKLVYTLK